PVFGRAYIKANYRIHEESEEGGVNQPRQEKPATDSVPTCSTSFTRRIRWKSGSLKRNPMYPGSLDVKYKINI
ncbi:MAG: hypothetical protein RMJ13_07655, partial [Elusimicrobiota bacterium]|nr:hypothetical protein [Elusimicrobiota bacterium]